MTLLLNVTDAVSAAPNFGISRTERELAKALLDDVRVEFVAIQTGRLWHVDREGLRGALARSTVGTTPQAERFGIDRVPATGRRARLRRALRPAPVAPVEAVALAARTPKPDEVLLSVGLDWVHGLVGEAERLHYGVGTRYVGFCYDMIPADHPEWLFPPDPRGFLDHFARVTRIADSVLCISESTRVDFIRHFPEFGPDRVHVLRLGADAAIETQAEHGRFAGQLFDGEPYAVYCATIDRRKNHQVLYRAARELVRRGVTPNFVFVGAIGNGVADLIDALRHDPEVRGRFIHVTNCDDAHLAAIYRRAAFAVFPSLYEGWGLGVTEALAHGRPCVIASGSSLGEAGLGVCQQVPPLATAAWADAIEAHFADPPTVPGIELPTWRAAGRHLLELVGG